MKDGLYLFGSRARGDNRPNSDVDILVVGRAAERHIPRLFMVSLEQGGIADVFVKGYDFESPFSDRAIDATEEVAEAIEADAIEITIEGALDLCMAVMRGEDAA